MELDRLRVLLVPGGGGSGPEHWHHRWAANDARCEWVHQRDPEGGTFDDWVGTLDRAINEASRPVVLVAHSLACVVVANWARLHSGPVVAALLVAPADVEGDWAGPESLYKRFAPIPLEPLPFASTVVASSDDPVLTSDRAGVLAQAWGAELAEVGPHLHLGSDADLGEWPVGRRLLDELLAR